MRKTWLWLVGLSIVNGVGAWGFWVAATWVWDLSPEQHLAWQGAWQLLLSVVFLAAAAWWHKQFTRLQRRGNETSGLGSWGLDDHYQRVWKDEG